MLWTRWVITRQWTSYIAVYFNSITPTHNICWIIVKKQQHLDQYCIGNSLWNIASAQWKSVDHKARIIYHAHAEHNVLTTVSNSSKLHGNILQNKLKLESVKLKNMKDHAYYLVIEIKGCHWSLFYSTVRMLSNNRIVGVNLIRLLSESGIF